MTIPEFPHFIPLDLPLKSSISDYLSGAALEASEYTFTNIYAFRDTYNFKVSLLNGNLIILKDTDPVSFFCPAGSTNMIESLDRMFNYLQQYNTEHVMERVPESFIKTYLENNPLYICSEDRDQFDYVYEIKELIALKGRKYHDKRNNVNKFRNQYAYEYITLTPDLIAECIEYEDYWCEVKECEKNHSLRKERCAIRQMLNNFRELNIKGGAIRIENKIAALTLGEKYLHDTIVIHVEKANPGIPGLYQIINQEFLMHEAGDCTYVNREQDLGVEGLRKAKMTYHPAKFIKKFRVMKR